MQTLDTGGKIHRLPSYSNTVCTLGKPWTDDQRVMCIHLLYEWLNIQNRETVEKKNISYKYE